MTPEQQIQQLQRKLNTKEYLLNVASNSSDYFEQQMQLAQAERDALQSMIDGAVDLLTFDFDKRSSVKLAIEILTGEGE